MIEPTVLLPEGITAARIIEIAGEHGARDVRLFGSRADRTAVAGSDLDLLVEFEPGRDLFDLVGLKQALEAETGLRVDVLTVRALSPYMREAVVRDAVPL